MQSKKKYNESVIDVYSSILSGERKCFPNDFLDKEICKQLIRYLLLDKLKLKRDEILKQNFVTLFREHKLTTVLRKFDGKRYDMIEYCFPEFNVKPWEIKQVSNGFWKSEQNRLSALLWMAQKENVDLDNIDEVREKITARKVYDYFGNRILVNSNNSLFELFDLYYKGKYKEWQLLSKIRVWTKEKSICAIRWMIDDIYHWSRDEVCQNISVKTFEENGLGSMLEHACRHSPLIALQMAYPEYNYTKEDIKCSIKEIN